MRALLASLFLFRLLASTPDQNLIARTRDRIRANRLTANERKFDQIGWVPSITEALRLAREHHRPVFLLTYYGNIATGRSCGDSFTLRANAFANDSIISTLNQYFVPVYRSWDELSATGSASAEDKAEHHRIIQEADARKIPLRDVRIFILNPEGHLLPADLGTSDAFRILRGLLQVVMELGTKQGDVLVKPKPQSMPPSVPAASLVLHTVARGSRTGNWREFPAENWTVLTKEQWAGLLPPEPDIQPGVSWAVAPELARTLLTTFYPATEEDSRKDRERNAVKKMSLKARILSVEDGVAIARLEASWSGKRSFYPGRPVDNDLDVKAEGFLRFPADRTDVYSLGLATTMAYFGEEEFTATLEDMKEIPAGPGAR